MMIFLLAHFFVSEPTVFMHDKPDVHAEVVSEAIYSESVVLLQERGEWIKIETVLDEYCGWVPKKTLYSRDDDFKGNLYINRAKAHLYHVPDIIYGPLLTLPFKSCLQLLKEEDNRWLKVLTVDGHQAYVQRGDITFSQEILSREEAASLSQMFLGLPYTWGGRSSFGYDCSGFVQMLYREMGYLLPRDSKDQILWEGLVAVEEEDLQVGDLLFFGYGPDKIRHVAFYLGEGRFIHASSSDNMPYLRINEMSDPLWNGAGCYPYRTVRALKYE